MTTSSPADSQDAPEPPAPPRSVPKWARSQATGLVMGLGLTFVVLGVFATGLFHVMLGSAFDDQKLDARGRVTEATPVASRHVASTSGGQVAIHDIDVVFEDPKGKRRKATIEETHRGQREAIETGTPLEIEYDPENPSIARWKGERLSPVGVALYWLGGAVVTFGLLIALVGFILGVRDKGLYRNGPAIRGRIDRVEPFVSNQRTCYNVDYSYEVEGRRVDSMWVAKGTAQPHVGPVWVVVDPSSPHRSVPVLEGY